MDSSLQIHSSTKPAKKSVVYSSNTDVTERGEETEITAQISIPTDGGWGWVVLLTSFLSQFFLDGVIFTFGCIFADMRDDLKLDESLVALVNSVEFAMYFMLSPLASALINRYGFRECAMVGSVISAVSLSCVYFANSFSSILVLYGICTGFGECLINVPANLVVGFYFERLRSLVIAIAATGSSFGCMVLFSVNGFFVETAGWRTTKLFHAGLFGICYFLGMTYKPLPPLFVTQTAAEPNVTVVNVSHVIGDGTPKETKSSTTEHIFQTLSNSNFPTAAAMVGSSAHLTPANTQASRLSPVGRKLTLTTIGPGEFDERQIKKITSLVTTDTKQDIDVTLQMEPLKKREFWARLYKWEKQAPEARPMYRDDVFYSGKIEQLPAYKKSDSPAKSKEAFAIEYQMAVTRAATTADIKDKTGIFTTATKRVIATMVDPKLLKRCSFRMLCTSCFFVYLGFLVPYIFLQERNKLEGIEVVHCNAIMSFVGFTNTLGKLTMGACACKMSPIKVYNMALFLSGILTIALNFSFSVYYQYTVAGIWGFFISSLVPLRSMVIVEVFGLESLTNATGIMLMFQGLACLISTPLSSLIKNCFGYTMSFNVAGVFLLCGSIALLRVHPMAIKEDSLVNKKSQKAP